MRSSVMFVAIVATACHVQPRMEGPIAHEAVPTAIVAIENVTLLSMQEGDAPFRDGQTVLIRGTEIAAVGSAAEISVPAGAVRVDGRGKFLMPGLADMHVHLEYFDDPSVLQLFVANGVTTVRSMDGRPFMLEWRRQVANGTLLGPIIHTAGPLLDGNPPMGPENQVVLNADEARTVVEQQHAAGYDFIKVYIGLSPATWRAVLAAARDRELAVVGHLPRGVSVHDAIAEGMHSIEHLGDFDDAIEADTSPFRGRYQWFKRLLGMPIDISKVESLGQTLRDGGVFTTPTLVQSEYEIATMERARGWLSRPGVEFIPSQGRDLWLERATGAAERMDADDWSRIELARRNRLATVAALHRAGAPLLVGTDTPNPFVVPGYALHEELQLFVEAGLTPLQVLGIATREAARHAGVLAETGTVETGKRADLLLLDANPLDEIRNTRRIAGVVLGGTWLPASTISAMLDTLELKIAP